VYHVFVSTQGAGRKYKAEEINKKGQSIQQLCVKGMRVYPKKVEGTYVCIPVCMYIDGS
jgi:hypothetical protein